MPGYLTLTELAKRVGVNASTLRRWCAAGKLPAEKFGKTWLVREAELGEITKDTRGRKAARAAKEAK